MTRHDTQTIQIDTDPSQVVRFLGDGANLARWAIGFAVAVRPRGDQWVVTTHSGAEVDTRVLTDDFAGTVDFVMTPAPGVTATAWTRVVPVADGSLLSFTQVQQPGMPDEIFDAQVSAVTHELAALRAMLEVQCPLFDEKPAIYLAPLSVLGRMRRPR